MRMRLNIRLSIMFMALLAGTLLSSCQKEEVKLDELKAGLNISISSLSSDSKDVSGTRADITDPSILAGTASERTAKCLDLFLFDGDGALVAHKRMDGSAGQIGGVSMVFPATNQDDSGVPANINITELVNSGGFGKRTLAAVANWDDAVMGGVSILERLQAEGNSLATLEQLVIDTKLTASTSGDQLTPFAAPGLLMFGKSSEQTYTNSAVIPTFNVDLVRLVSRLDLKLSVSGSMAAANKVAEVRVMQASNKVFMSAPNVARDESTMPTFATQTARVAQLFTNSPISTLPTSFSKSIFMPENNLKVDSYNRNNATYVLVNIPNGGSDNWYRFWVNEADNRTPGTLNYHVKRNTIYEISAIIDTRGGATPEEAVETQDLHFNERYVYLSYSVQDNMVGAPGTVLLKVGSTVTVAAVRFGSHGPNGYTIDFFTSPDRSGIAYNAGDTFIITENTTLYSAHISQ